MDKIAKNDLWKEVVHGECKNIHQLENIINKYIAGINKRNLYRVPTHERYKDGYIYADIEEQKKNTYRYTEKRLAYAFANLRNHPNLGEFIDLQVPFRSSKKDKGIGEIDLISKKNNSLFLIELKKMKSSESLPRAIMEIFLYCTLVNKFRVKFIEDFNAKSYKIYPTILVPIPDFEKRVKKLKNDEKSKKLIILLNNWLSDAEVGFGNLRFFTFSQKETSKLDFESNRFKNKPNMRIIFPRGDKTKLDIKEFKVG